LWYNSNKKWGDLLISMTDKQILLESDFSPEKVKKLQDIPGAIWLKTKRAWGFPHDCAMTLCNEFPDDNIMPDVRELAQIQLGRKELLVRLSLNKMEPQGIYMAHQRRCIDIAKIYDRFGFFLDTGTGKTVMACGIIDESNYAEKWLVVVPRPIIKSAVL
jgi:hypothetical protein